jgi:hypothetical protein
VLGNSISGDVSAAGWYTASMMISAVLGDDLEEFGAATSPGAITRWEHEALSSLAAAAISELAEKTGEPAQAVLARLRDSFLGRLGGS